jgi:flavin-dependent dehydrogenase
MQADVAILGAGPAGSVLALRLQQLGLQTLIVEKAAFPRPRIGESLSRGVWQQLHFLGAAEAVAALNFPPCEQIDLQWGNEVVLRKIESPGMLADRARFDQTLLNLAQAFGARVFQPAKLVIKQTPSLTSDGWLCQIDGADRAEVSVRWLVDASGSGRALRGEMHTAHPGYPATVALHAYWQGAGPTPRLASFEHGWAWRVPIHTEQGVQVHIFAFVDQRADRTRGGSHAQRYESYLHAAEMLRAGATRISPVAVVDATPAMIDVPIRERMLWVGESALRIDPLAASGVQCAMQSALQAAVVLNTCIRRPADAGLAENFYAAALDDTRLRHADMARRLYQAALVRYSDQEFWSARAQLDEQSKLAEAAVNQRMRACARMEAEFVVSG